MEVTFIGVGVKVVFSKVLADLTDMFMVLFHVVQVDEDVIQVDKDAYIKHVREDVIHEVVVVKEAWEVWEGWTGSGSLDSLRKQSK